MKKIDKNNSLCRDWVGFGFDVDTIVWGACVADRRTHRRLQGMVVLQQLVGLDAPLACTLFSTLRGPLSLPSRPARAVSRRLAPGGWGTPAMWQLGGHRLLAPAVGLRATSTAAVSSCRAVMLPRFGGPEVLEVRPAVGVPSLKPRDVLVRSRAVSINPLDLRVSL